LKNPKKAKNNKNPKIMFSNIFALFLAFSASSQKNLNFKKYFEGVQLLTHYFYNH
jgi:hypothetical protein